MANEISDEVAELLIRMAVDPAFAEQYRSSVAFRNAEHTRRALNDHAAIEAREDGLVLYSRLAERKWARLRLTRFSR
jgi:hypothetical protein